MSSIELHGRVQALHLTQELHALHRLQERERGSTGTETTSESQTGLFRRERDNHEPSTDGKDGPRFLGKQVKFRFPSESGNAQASSGDDALASDTAGCPRHGSRSSLCVYRPATTRKRTRVWLGRCGSEEALSLGLDERGGGGGEEGDMEGTIVRRPRHHGKPQHGGARLCKACVMVGIC
ncbi:hypothetical protein EYF80_020924 [Liparis tanakae]|uniref:Uncharacterized protein n=1 Tax=Liparis tanakae TaxID=230148 RepID=A0A4Z2HSW6_9TELE|nr:hypothetical protein EYF80_020924 [Liparis tanakae]